MKQFRCTECDFGPCKFETTTDLEALPSLCPLEEIDDADNTAARWIEIDQDSKITGLSTESKMLIDELISSGWHFMLNIGSEADPGIWEADFTRKLENGFWDNHKVGFSTNVNEAIKQAYNNIKNGIRLDD
jgi:hypothetical protein